MKSNPIPFMQKVAFDLVGTYLTQALEEKAHVAVNRVAAAARYIEADTNLAYKGVTEAIKKAPFRQIADEFCAAHEVNNRHSREVLLQALKIEGKKQESYWHDLDLRINHLANLENVTEAHLTEVESVYTAPEYDTNVNAAILSTVSLYCTEMEPIKKRQFAQLLEKTMVRQVKLGLIRE